MKTCKKRPPSLPDGGLNIFRRGEHHSPRTRLVFLVFTAFATFTALTALAAAFATFAFTAFPAFSAFSAFSAFTAGGTGGVFRLPFDALLLEQHGLAAGTDAVAVDFDDLDHHVFAQAGHIAGLFHARHAAVHNLIEGAVKIAIFLGYLILCSRQKDVRRVFCYHGAEHKTIFCYEAGLPLTVENARIQPKHHPRCGTSFLFVVIVVSILCSSIVFSYVNWQNLWVRVAMHLLLLIPVVGVTYEFNRFVGRHDNAVTRILSAPGMWLQNFTTNEPDDSMLEVAIEALKLVLPEEQGKDAW